MKPSYRSRGEFLLSFQFAHIAMPILDRGFFIESVACCSYIREVSKNFTRRRAERETYKRVPTFRIRHTDTAQAEAWSDDIANT